MDVQRKLVSVRKIAALDPIPGADAIEVASVDGWKLVVKKGEFKPGDLCAYFEIDSFLQETDSRYAFLMNKGVREFEGIRGHKLRTIKLRGQISQGLALPISLFFDDFEGSAEDEGQELSEFFTEGTDLTSLLKIVKYEAPISASIAGQVKGSFPSFIRKTDQERCQNLKDIIFGYTVTRQELSMNPSQVTPEALAAGRLELVDGKVFAVSPARADPNAGYEVTVKLDGTSVTYFHYNGEIGVCSRNLQLKISDENKDNALIRMFFDSGLQLAISQLDNLAIQGELTGPGIQGNRENFKVPKYFIFDVQNLETGTYFTPVERAELMSRLIDLGVNPQMVTHVPILHSDATLQSLGLTSIDDLLKFAEGPSVNNPIREGVVFKRVDGQFSFKAISNKFLEREKD